MIQVVSAYLLKQRGEVIEDGGGSKDKIVDRRWIINKFRMFGPLTYKHLYASVPTGGFVQISSLYRDLGHWEVFDGSAKWVSEPDNTTIKGKMSSEHYMTPDGDISFREYSNYLWIWHTASETWSGAEPYFGSTFTTATYRIMDNMIVTGADFDIEETGVGYKRDWNATLSLFPRSSGSDRSIRQEDGVLMREARAYPIGLRLGCPVFSTLEDGQRYVDAVAEYLSSMTSEHLDDVSDALNYSENMP